MAVMSLCALPRAQSPAMAAEEEASSRKTAGDELASREHLRRDTAGPAGAAVQVVGHVEIMSTLRQLCKELAGVKQSQGEMLGKLSGEIFLLKKDMACLLGRT